MSIDAKTLAQACGADGDLKVVSHLCRAQLETFEQAATDNDRLLVACTQEAPLFLETANELGDEAAELFFTNIRAIVALPSGK